MLRHISGTLKPVRRAPGADRPQAPRAPGGDGAEIITTGWAEAAELTGAVRAELSPRERAQRAEQQQDRADAAAEAERLAQLEEARDQRLFRMAQLGLGSRDVLADAMAMSDEDGEYEAARSVMERIERRRAARAKAIRFEAEQLSAVSRAAEPAGIAAANALAARLAGPGRPAERRPFAARRGVAVRGNTPQVMCVECAKVGASPEESFLIHADPAPVPASFPAADAYRPAGSRETGRHRGRDREMIYR